MSGAGVSHKDPSQSELLSLTTMCQGSDVRAQYTTVQGKAFFHSFFLALSLSLLLSFSESFLLSLGLSLFGAKHKGAVVIRRLVAMATAPGDTPLLTPCSSDSFPNSGPSGPGNQQAFGLSLYLSLYPSLSMYLSPPLSLPSLSPSFSFQEHSSST